MLSGIVECAQGSKGPWIVTTHMLSGFASENINEVKY